MKPVLEPRHDLTPMEIDAIEDRLYEHNRVAIGRHDGEGLGLGLSGQLSQVATVQGRAQRQAATVAICHVLNASPRRRRRVGRVVK